MQYTYIKGYFVHNKFIVALRQGYTPYNSNVTVNNNSSSMSMQRDPCIDPPGIGACKSVPEIGVLPLGHARF